jgi:hypothetical protein
MMTNIYQEHFCIPLPKVLKGLLIMDGISGAVVSYVTCLKQESFPTGATCLRDNFSKPLKLEAYSKNVTKS